MSVNLVVTLKLGGVANAPIVVRGAAWLRRLLKQAPKKGQLRGVN